MPAGRAEAAEQALPRRVAVEMKRLGIEARGEGDDPFRGEDVASDIGFLTEGIAFRHNHAPASGAFRIANMIDPSDAQTRSPF